MGISCDWSRNKFTLDKDVISTSCDTFIKMYNEGFVYRGKKCIHWNPKFQTSLSDIETKFKDEVGKFYYFKYGPFTIGTSRPETKFSDKYIIVHPDDERYKKYKHNQKFIVEWINGPIEATLLKDETADMEMGSGAMTITPWHSQVDFELACKYDLPVEQIIDWDGKLLPVAGEFAGLKISVAREKIVEKLKAKGLLERIDENYEHAVRVCDRTNVVIEPQIKSQWFVKMDELSKTTLDAMDNKEYRILTKTHEKIFRHWMSNPIDWNISRQIIWGIQIPAWFKNKDTDKEEIKISKEVQKDGWVQDTDTFDTWFSSGHWPLVTLGYPDSDDMKFYPTQVMETGADLIFKWVPRMIIFGLYLKKEVPFKDIYLHGMTQDAKGVKMSKSKGNGLSPLDLVEEFGTDATRMSFVVATPPGMNTILTKDKVRAYKKFSNKIWNIARFILENIEGENFENQKITSLKDKELLKNLDEEVSFVTEHIKKYRMDLAAERLYHYVWHEVADKILEDSKNIFSDGKQEDKDSRKQTLYIILSTSLKLLHPFTPFITEIIWKEIPDGYMKDDKLIMISKWPEYGQDS